MDKNRLLEFRIEVRLLYMQPLEELAQRLGLLSYNELHEDPFRFWRSWGWV